MSRTTHSTALPYSQAQWPSISLDVEQAILALLLPLLRPLGGLRKSTARPSRGRGRAKRKAPSLDDNGEARTGKDLAQNSEHVTIGLTSTYRALEAQARRLHEEATAPAVPLAVVFVCRAVLPDPACNSLPLLLSCASKASTPSPLRLVPTSEQTAVTIAQALDLPRASMIGICEEAAGSKALMQYVRDNVPAVAVASQLSSLAPVRYLPLKVTSRQIPIGKQQKPAEAHKRPVEGVEAR